MLATKYVLSGSSDGRMIKVVQTATAGTLIHTGPSDSKVKDEVWLWAVNSDTSDRKLTIEWGGVSSPDDLIEMTITAEDGPIIVVPGWIMQGNATAKVIRAFCASANVVMIGGYVNRIIQA